LLGVLNLRGAIVPIIDLRVRFKLPSAAFTPLTGIVVIPVKTSSGAQDCGLVGRDLQLAPAASASQRAA
jgi:purine-binding chemotaxis protein CheW